MGNSKNYHSRARKRTKRSLVVKKLIKARKEKVSCLSFENSICIPEKENSTRLLLEDVHKSKNSPQINESASSFSSELTDVREITEVSSKSPPLIDLEFLLSESNVKSTEAPDSEHALPVNNELHEFSFISQDEYESVSSHKLIIENEKNKERKNEIAGNRIVDLNYILQWAVTLQYNHAKICTSGMLSMKEDIRWGSGLVSEIIFKCSSCPREYKYFTEDPNKKSKINYGAVWGTLATGSTYGHLKEFLSVMDIPPMSQHMFMKIENDVGEIWKDSLANEMEEAGRIEREHAISIGDVDDDGKPFITVYLDGGWSKRSYGHGYNAASGVAVIIGKFSGKVLFLSVRNKYCSICTRAANKRISPGEHVCYRNWANSSSAMEADIVVEGFKTSLSMHGVRYKKFIADGDSSVYAKIREKVDYGLEVEKIECTNHALKNFGKALRSIKSDTSINLSARKLLTGNIIERLEKFAKICINVNCGGSVENLKKNLSNGPQHIFGEHRYCENIYCNEEENVTKNKFPAVVETGLLVHITAAFDNLQKKAHKLIANETNNRAETFMAILARFNAGKRLNLIQRGSFERRTYASGLRYNSSFNWHHGSWKKMMGESPGDHFKKYMAKQIKIKDQNNKSKNAVADSSHKKKVRRQLLPDIDYGPKAIQPELSKEEYDSEANRILSSLQISESDQKLIASKTIGQFSCSTYKVYKEKRLTASNFGAVIKRLDTTPCHSLVKSILYGTGICTPAMEYGKTMESVARHRFAEEYNLEISPCGLFIDIQHGFLGASPDGLIGDTGLLEIKCLFNVAKSHESLEEYIKHDKTLCLELNNNKVRLKRRHNYFFQIQGQLHICKRKYCYFVVYVGQQKPLYVEKIEKEDIWNTEMLPKLQRFYFQCILPEIINRNIPKGLKCKDAQFIIDARCRKQNK